MSNVLKSVRGHVNAWLCAEDGEVTIAWVVLTASLVTLSVLVMTSIGGGTQELAGQMDTELTDREISTY